MEQNKKQNRWERIFQEFMELIEFDIIKHRVAITDPDGNTGIWSVEDRQGANLGDIESERYANSRELVDRFCDGIYVNDYIVGCLEECFDEIKSILPQEVIDDWHNMSIVDFHKKYPDVLKENAWDFDVLLMFEQAHQINLENLYYKEEN